MIATSALLLHYFATKAEYNMPEKLVLAQEVKASKPRVKVPHTYFLGAVTRVCPAAC